MSNDSQDQKKLFASLHRRKAIKNLSKGEKRGCRRGASSSTFSDDFETSVKAIDSFSLRNATTKKKLWNLALVNDGSEGEATEVTYSLLHLL